MTNEQKVRALLNPRLREIYGNIGGTICMGDLAAYVGQPMSDAMLELAEFIESRERQRAVEICDLTLSGMFERELCARAIRNPNTKHPSGD